MPGLPVAAVSLSQPGSLPQLVPISISTIGDFDQVIAELGLDRTVYLVHFRTKYHLVEFGHHLSRAKFTECSSLLSGRAIRVLLGYLSKVGSILDLLFE